MITSPDIFDSLGAEVSHLFHSVLLGPYRALGKRSLMEWVRFRWSLRRERGRGVQRGQCPGIHSSTTQQQSEDRPRSLARPQFPPCKVGELKSPPYL